MATTFTPSTIRTVACHCNSFFDFKGCKPSGSVTADKNTLSPIMTFSNLTNIIILEQLNSRKTDSYCRIFLRCSRGKGTSLR